LLDIYGDSRGRNVFLRASRPHRLLGMLDVPYAGLVRDLGLDLVHYPNQFGGAFLPRIVKRVATLHDLTPILFPQLHPRSRVLGYRMLARYSLRRCDRVIVYSANTRRDLLNRGLAAQGAIVNIPLGVNPAFKPVTTTGAFARRYQLTRPFILTVGVLEPRKNHVLLFEVLRRMRERCEQVDLIIIGRPGWRWRNPLEQPQFKLLRPWVRILEDVPDADLVEFYNRAAVFAYPSLYEGFGLPILEAMACGAPVVSATGSSLPEVAGDAALYADPRDAEGFAAQVARVLRDPALRAQMVEAGLRRAREFSWRRTAEQTLAVYRNVCGVAPAAVWNRNGAGL
jgi:glycosyltransferase involved in cell wall biosynthesis